MRRFIAILVGVFSVSLFLGSPAQATKCPKDSQQVGRWCVDTYEASVWATRDKRTIDKIKRGTITDATQLVGTATQHGATIDDYEPGCPNLGNGCTDFYAVSIPGVIPSRSITWFQAAAACRNAGKELLPNNVWQVAALGTPDTGGGADDGVTTCNTDGLALGLVPTGSRAACISDVEVFDMVGNVSEWVADWLPRSTACPSWGFISDDVMCLAGASTTAGPGALIRGGTIDGSFAGVLAVDGTRQPNGGRSGLGFRCGR